MQCVLSVLRRRFFETNAPERHMWTLGLGDACSAEQQVMGVCECRDPDAKVMSVQVPFKQPPAAGPPASAAIPPPPMPPGGFSAPGGFGMLRPPSNIPPPPTFG